MKKLKSSLDIALEFNDALVNKTEDGRNNTINLEVFVDMINAAQINAIEYTVQRCADEAKVKDKIKSTFYNKASWTTVVDKKSILNVADKIKNELK